MHKRVRITAWLTLGLLSLALAALLFHAFIVPFAPGLRAALALPLSYLAGSPARVSFASDYHKHCAECHGASLEGASARPLVGRPLDYVSGDNEVTGKLVRRLTTIIAVGIPEKGMPGIAHLASRAEIRRIAMHVAEQRRGLGTLNVHGVSEIHPPNAPVKSEVQRFIVETIASGLDYAYSIAPLPDGSLLVSEKVKGLSIVQPDGRRTGVSGTPKTSKRGLSVLGGYQGVGWLLDVAPHPDYATNQWVYLAHTHLCEDCGGVFPKTMVRLLRGRIRNASWRDEEVLWSVPTHFYTGETDTAASTRIAFDDQGMVYFTVGAKADSGFLDLSFSSGVQDLSTPYGKVHRLHDDGRIPDNNPFVSTSNAMPSIWTLGHRAPQGLEFDPSTQRLWSSEMGPRGGDEVNLLASGGNYGWPHVSHGLHYDGGEVGNESEQGRSESPVIDLTPSPAASSFVIYRGAAFPGWQGDMLLGTLKAASLYRFVFEDGEHVYSEVLMPDLARIRDIEVAADGRIYLLLEHVSGSRIVRLAPDADAATDVHRTDTLSQESRTSSGESLP